MLRNGRATIPPDEEAENHAGGDACALAAWAALRSCYYLRMDVRDEPGVLAQVATVMARNGVSIASVIQRPAERPGAASLILTTHESTEAALRAAREQLAALPVVLGPPLLLPIGVFQN